MKNIAILLWSIAIISSCSDDEAMNNTSLGQWSLENSSGGIIGANDDFAAGDVFWDFIDDDQLVINNQYNGNNVYSGPDSGTYSYRIITNSRGEFLEVDNFEYGELIVDNDILTLNSSRYIIGDASDGILFSFHR